ncbi:M17 family metallopeptidase [Testudinibacter aquarius]|uniref:Leucyl aminopeptidase n=1 Tax=Testudinibacter aquarius TaxID=1524974 RepID=A0A4R3Y1G2_9PAST|nr:leucyl aminopeptidase family protein [Testudinibacter aquarius]KAE9529953.1 hypothetical protein A1D24_07640 [Testudinibacter aquarius]TCV83853.1 leucyl aminopeptidase [Testudinibacter aquarius]TNG87897.1 leucyl aminopeptidase family protein [Testudinibacter aquarius]
MKLSFLSANWQEYNPYLSQSTLFVWRSNLDYLETLPILASLKTTLERYTDNTVSIGLNPVCENIYFLPENPGACQQFISKQASAALKTNFEFLRKKIRESHSSIIFIDVSLFDINKIEDIELIKQLLIEVYNQSYNLQNLNYKTLQKNPIKQFGALFKDNEQQNTFNPIYQEIIAIVSGMIRSRQYSDSPSNYITPEYMAFELKSYAKKHCLMINILNSKDLIKQNLNALHAVGKGSHNLPYLVELSYQGNINSIESYTFVGKGITFDTGGLWLKSGEGMATMKYDMCGAAVLIGLLDTVIQMKLPVNLNIILGFAENMPTALAMRPGDIVTMHSKHTVEIINTDAEGRLILADMLSYAANKNPTYLIDIATLTGAVVKALGYDISGMMSNDATLTEKFIIASQQTQDRIWQLPYDESFLKQVKSQIADFCNTPSNNAAICVSAGFFLSRFIHNCKWLHLDISGTALQRDHGIYASGRPIPLLYQFLKNQTLEKQ